MWSSTAPTAPTNVKTVKTSSSSLRKWNRNNLKNNLPNNIKCEYTLRSRLITHYAALSLDGTARNSVSSSPAPPPAPPDRFRA